MNYQEHIKYHAFPHNAKGFIQFPDITWNKDSYFNQLTAYSYSEMCQLGGSGGTFVKKYSPTKLLIAASNKNHDSATFNHVYDRKYTHREIKEMDTMGNYIPGFPSLKITNAGKCKLYTNYRSGCNDNDGIVDSFDEVMTTW